MKIIRAVIPDIFITEPTVFEDRRGFFYTNYNKEQFNEAAGMNVEFVQDNHSRSKKNVLRGLHYQIKQSQGKLVQVTNGEIFDVAVDIRKSSPTFGQWVGQFISAANKKQFWVPPGFAHGFFVLSDVADIMYKITDYYAPEHERCIRWDDTELNIDWPLEGQPLVSEKDISGVLFSQAEVFD